MSIDYCYQTLLINNKHWTQDLQMAKLSNTTPKQILCFNKVFQAKNNRIRVSSKNIRVTLKRELVRISILICCTSRLWTQNIQINGDSRMFCLKYIFPPLHFSRTNQRPDHMTTLDQSQASISPLSPQGGVQGREGPVLSVLKQTKIGN